MLGKLKYLEVSTSTSLKQVKHKSKLKMRFSITIFEEEIIEISELALTSNYLNILNLRK